MHARQLPSTRAPDPSSIRMRRRRRCRSKPTSTPKRCRGPTSLENKARIEGGEVKHGETGEVVAGGRSRRNGADRLAGCAVRGAVVQRPHDRDRRPDLHPGRRPPYAATTTVFFNTSPRIAPEGFTEPSIVSRVKDVDVKLPAGFYGNPLATLEKEGHPERCPQSAVHRGRPRRPGPARLLPSGHPGGRGERVPQRIHQASPKRSPSTTCSRRPGSRPSSASSTRTSRSASMPTSSTKTPTGANTGSASMSSDVNEAYDVWGVQLTLWGEPASPSHTAERFKNLFETRRRTGRARSAVPDQPGRLRGRGRSARTGRRRRKPRPGHERAGRQLGAAGGLRPRGTARAPRPELEGSPGHLAAGHRL